MTVHCERASQVISRVTKAKEEKKLGWGELETKYRFEINSLLYVACCGKYSRHEGAEIFMCSLTVKGLPIYVS